jgi:alkylation response protein AidB-like acyl-CoA dehydrogenase
MDFSLTQEQRDLRELARKILDEVSPVETLPDFEEPQDWFNEKLWNELAKAGLLGVGLPSDVGGLDGGIVELSLLLEELGRSCAPVPLLPTLVMAAMPIDRHGSASLRARLLPRIVTGELILTAAIAESTGADPMRPQTRAVEDGDAWTLDGVKDYVPAAKLAGLVVVSASTPDDGVGLFLVDPNATGVTLEAQATTTGELEYRMQLAGVAVGARDVLAAGEAGRRALDDLIDHTLAGLCALELGVADQALRMTARYTAERKQFDKPIASFQAVAQRAGDAYIDVEAVRLATQQAVWRLSQGLPARRELAIAKFWAAEGGHRACYAAQHLHGGIGVDTDYPLHHYYLLSRRIELTLGGSNTWLAWLGERLAGDSWAPAG